MTQRNWAWEAKNLLPHLSGMLGGGVTVQAGGGGLVAHALNSTTWHTGTLNESQAPWAVTSTVYDAHVANANAHHARDHVLATNAGLGGTHTISGATAGHVLRASGATAAAFAQLQHADLGGVTADQHHAQLHGMLDTAHHNYTGGAALDVFGLSAPSTLARLTPSDSVSSVQTALLKATNGTITLDQVIATARLRSALLDTAAGSMTLSPAGTAVLPTGSILKDLGDYNRKWRSLYAAELYVETLVAQDVLATIGGRIMVAPTTKLIADLASGGTTIDVEHNNLTSAFVYMASAPGGIAQVEVMKCGATATPITGGYRYTVTRNLDGSGANNWVAGDAVANIGAVAGQGWIELTSTNTARNHLGPTIAIYARTGTAAWTDVKPVVALGNLRSFVDYSADEYGFALGNDLALDATTGFSGMTGDRTSGLRMFNTDIAQYNGTALTGVWQPSGTVILSYTDATTDAQRDFLFSSVNGTVRIGRTGTNVPNLIWNGSSLQLRQNTTPVITLDSSGASYFAGAMTIGTSGGIYQGSGTFASPTTGLKLWNDSGIGRLVGYLSGVEQAGFNSSGKITAGAGAVTLDAGGITIGSSTVWSYGRAYSFANGTGNFGGIGGWSDAIQNYVEVISQLTTTKTPVVQIHSEGNATYPGRVYLEAVGSTTGRVDITSTKVNISPLLEVTGAVTASGAVSGTTGTFSGNLLVSGGGVAISQGAPYYGVNIQAVAGGWARGLYFRTSADALLGGWGAYGSGDAINYFWVGNAHNDYALRALPATGNVEVTGTLDVGGAIKRGGTAGGIFVPMTPTNLTDSGSTVWSGVSRAAGTYTFDVNSAANGSVPAAATAVAVMGTFTWTNANNATYASIQKPSAAYSIIARALGSAIASDVAGVVQIDTNGQFTVTIVNATSNTSLLRIVGYYI